MVDFRQINMSFADPVIDKGINGNPNLIIQARQRFNEEINNSRNRFDYNGCDGMIRHLQTMFLDGGTRYPGSEVVGPELQRKLMFASTWQQKKIFLFL